MSERAPGRPSAAAARPRRRSAGGKAPSANASCRTSTHRRSPWACQNREPAAGRAGAAGLPSRPGGAGKAAARARRFPSPQLKRRRRRRRKRRRGGGRKKTWRRVLLAVWRCQRGAGSGAGRALARRPRSPHCAPRARTMSPRGPRRAGPGQAAPHRPPGTAACAAAVALPPLPVVLLLLLLAQEFLNFKEQVTSTCPPLSLGHRAWPPKSRGTASRRLASALPPAPPESIWREGEREKGRVHEDYKVTNMAPQSLLPDHCKEMKTHFKLNHLQLTRSPCLPLPAQHPVQIFAN
ncbi:uncharacterized protein LOC129210924 [Grus americana]|uniref:uncharacterized protein LOC129210924 n=1 Tax=Grus americana TaxID=9117 RepID=UPI002407E42C|nr:uncharacterized protein LOC129210924 [Grus americana]